MNVYKRLNIAELAKLNGYIARLLFDLGKYMHGSAENMMRHEVIRQAQAVIREYIREGMETPEDQNEIGGYTICKCGKVFKNDAPHTCTKGS